MSTTEEQEELGFICDALERDMALPFLTDTIRSRMVQILVEETRYREGLYLHSRGPVTPCRSQGLLWVA